MLLALDSSGSDHFEAALVVEKRCIVGVFLNETLALAHVVLGGRGTMVVAKFTLLLFVLQKFLKDIIVGLEAPGVREQDLLVCLEPLLGLQTVLSERDQVQKHHDHDSADADRNSNSYTLRTSIAPVGCSTELKQTRSRLTIVDGKVGEARKLSLAERKVLSAVNWIVDFVNCKNAERHWLRVVQVR